jgi:hypothetical protein
MQSLNKSPRPSKSPIRPMKSPLRKDVSKSPMRKDTSKSPMRVSKSPINNESFPGSKSS